MIRSARAEDATILCAGEREWARTGGKLISLPEELHPEVFSSLIAKLSNGSGCYLVAEEEGRIIGHGYLQPMDLSAVSHVFRLTLVVHRGFEGRGTGKALMQALLEWAKSSPAVKKIELLVRAKNETAIGLYRGFGFVEEGRFRKRVRLADGSYIDDISMAWFPHRPAS
jgi:putative acetyltransferase